MAKKKARPARNPWSASDMKMLHKLAGKSSTREIAKQLGRTAGAVQQKAGSEEISLAVTKRSK